jgi:hypothetical protein
MGQRRRRVSAVYFLAGSLAEKKEKKLFSFLVYYYPPPSDNFPFFSSFVYHMLSYWTASCLQPKRPELLRAVASSFYLIIIIIPSVQKKKYLVFEQKSYEEVTRPGTERATLCGDKLVSVFRRT